MWPAHRDLYEQTLAAEQAVEDLYSEALLRWAPIAAAAVLPTFDAEIITAAGDDLPPNPEAVESTITHWEAIIADVVMPGVSALWEQAAEHAVTSQGLTAAFNPLPAVMRGAKDVMAAVAGKRGDFLADYTQLAGQVPATVRTELRRLIVAADKSTTRAQMRKTVRTAITPGSQMLRKVARRLGYQGASILNHATMAVASAGGDADRKMWRAILDERTRDSHWEADGQIAPLGGTFTVGGAQMGFPGDPRAPIREVANCRCRLVMLGVGEEPKPRAVPAEEAGKREERGVSISASAGQESAMSDTETVEATPAVQAPDPEPDGQLVTKVEGQTTHAEGQVGDVAGQMAEKSDTTIADQVADGTPDGETFRTFNDAVIAFIGVPTSDNRVLAKNIELSIRTPPLPLMWMRHTGDGSGHVDAFTVGVIESARVDDDKVLASGYLLNNTEADEAAEQLKHGVTRPSVDLGSAQWALTNEDGDEITEDMFWDMPLNAKVFRTFNAAELMGMTLVATPAFGDTSLQLSEEREARSGSLTAAAYEPRIYQTSHFSDPKLTEPTLPTLGDDGRVYGHIAWWKSFHRTLRNKKPPRSPSQYAHFHTSPAVKLDDGTSLPVGRLTVGTGHAPGDLGGIPAQAHYDNTGSCWALVRVGEDAHGIWFSGVTAPWATPELIEQGLSAPLSGDWRDFGQGLDLVAALSVNTPGFIARGREDRNGRPLTLVASMGPNPHDIHPKTLTIDDIKAAVVEALADQSFAMEQERLLARAALITRPKTPNEQIGELLARATVS
jgi:hypothetical protein